MHAFDPSDESAYIKGMPSETLGISDISLYFPAPRIDLSSILDVRSAEAPDMERKLRRAVESTGQKAIRFPEPFEDNVSLAATAALKALRNAGSRILNSLRYIAVGTETAIDHSKPISSFVHGLLQRAGLALPRSLSNFQVQHACAGGTLALLSVASLIGQSPRAESGLVLCSDVARYETKTTAEYTQGAGAVGLVVEKDPKLLRLDLATPGYSSQDVDDFFRPLGSDTARVKGQYSMKCYIDAAEGAFLDHCERRGQSPEQVLSDTDYFVFHVPFARMAYTAARHILAEHLKLVDGEVDEFLKPRGFFEALESTAQVGNIYTGSAYLNLASLLQQQWRLHGDKIVGRKILLLSYGSGNTMVVLQAEICADAPSVIASWDSLLGNPRTASFEEYADWTRRDVRVYNGHVDTGRVPTGVYYLDAIREDGYREYAFKT